MFWEVFEGVIQIRCPMVNFYLLKEKDKWWLIDSGFIHGFSLLEKCLDSYGLKWEGCQGILLTHGHLDHVFNLARIQEQTGAPVFIHESDIQHLDGRYGYSGLSRVCGLLEFVGRLVFGYKRGIPNKEICDLQMIDAWGGLEVWHTPGHTNGHVCYFSKKHDLVFTGDLVANDSVRVMKPWPWLNTNPQMLNDSITRLVTNLPSRVLANHCDKSSPTVQRDRIIRKYGNLAN